MPADRVRASRGRAAALVVGLAGLTALSTVPTWLTATAGTALRGEVRVVATGAEVAPAVLAAAVALLAAAAALALVGRLGRWVVAVVLAGCGVLVVVSAAAVIADPAGAVLPVVAEQTGVGRIVGPVTVGAGPWVAVVLGLVAVVATGWLLLVSRRWAVSSRRHEVPSGESGAGTPDDRAAWDALSRGEDPS